MASVVLTWDGHEYAVDLDSITPKEFRQIKSHLGLKAGAFLQSFAVIGEVDADAIVAALWLGERRAGVTNPTWKDDVPWLQLMGSITQVVGDEEEGEQAPKAGSET